MCSLNNLGKFRMFDNIQQVTQEYRRLLQIPENTEKGPQAVSASSWPLQGVMRFI